MGTIASSAQNGRMTTELLTTEELAAFLKVPRATIYGWRYEGGGPPCLKIGRHLRFRVADVERWLEREADRK